MSRDAELVAEELLREFGITRPPVDPVSIARGLGIDVLNTDPPKDGASGFLIHAHPDTDGPVIGVNRRHSLVRRRFTVSHEIGHYCLEHAGGLHMDDVTLSWRDDLSAAGEDEIEIEANRFAASLLMPRAWVEERFRANPFDIADDDALKALARGFKVSVQSMTYRLTNLRLIR